MAALLASVPDRAYPPEFVYSRIRGKGTHLITDWKLLVETGLPPERMPAGGADAALWMVFLDEMAWLWSRMNELMRSRFIPVFQFFELRTILICLRSGGGRQGPVPESLLAHSMLSKEVKNVLAGHFGIGPRLDRLEQQFRLVAPEFRHFRRILEREKLQGVERHIYSQFLGHANRNSHEPVIRDFFIRLTDITNLVTLFKHVRWKGREIPRFTGGGKLRIPVLERCARENDMGAVVTIASGFTGMAGSGTDPVRIENALLREMTRFLRLRSRDDSGTAFLLYYIWKCSMQSRNLGLLLAGSDLERNVLEKELVT